MSEAAKIFEKQFLTHNSCFVDDWTKKIQEPINIESTLIAPIFSESEIPASQNF